MPVVLAVVCYLIAIICFVMVGIGRGDRGRVSLLGVGLAAWVLVPLVNAIDALG